jgi:hypothetical protein
MDAGAAQFALSTTQILIAQRALLGATEAPPASKVLEVQAALAPAKGKRGAKQGGAVKAADSNEAVSRAFRALLTDVEVRRHVNANLWDNIEYFNKESFESLVQQLLAVHLALRARDQKLAKDKAVVAKDAARAKALADALLAHAAAAEYQIAPVPASPIA